MKQPCVVLVHGYLRQGLNMRFLAQKLAALGYATLSPTLPAVLGNVAGCSERLAAFLEENLPKGAAPVHFVGHSMGGLIIRHYLSAHRVSELGRVVLIGVPNRGSPQSRNVTDRIPALVHLSPALSDLAEPGLDIPPPLNDPAPDIGVIAGTHSRLFGNFLLGEPGGENDGRVRVESARFSGAADEILLPLNHIRLHWRVETVRLVDSFLRTGKFRKAEEPR